MLGQGLGEVLAKYGAIHGKGSPGGYLVAIGGVDDQRSQLAQFRLQKTGGAIATHGPKGIATDQLPQIAGVVGGALALGTHFVKSHIEPRLGDLPSCFGAR
jgi:hypothetical protein